MRDRLPPHRRQRPRGYPSPQLLFDYRCHVPSGKLGKEQYPPGLARCMQRLRDMNLEGELGGTGHACLCVRAHVYVLPCLCACMFIGGTCGLRPQAALKPCPGPTTPHLPPSLPLAHADISRHYGFHVKQAAILQRRASDMLHHGFEWALGMGAPTNPRGGPRPFLPLV